MFRRAIPSVFLLALLLSAVSYSAAETAPTGEGKEAKNAASEVILSLGDAKLTLEQINWIQPDASDSQIAWLADRWLENELLYAEAEKRGLTSDPKVKFVAEMTRKSRFSQELRMRVQDAVKITDANILAYYQQNKNTDPRLAQPGYLTFAHVRTRTLEEAQDVLNKIKAGEDISELAKKVSVAEDGRRGGMVRKYMYSAVERRYGAKFLEAITSAKENDLVGPVEVDKAGGYEVAIKKGQIKPVPRPFEEVKDRIKARLEAEEKDKAFKSLMDSLRKEAAGKIVKSPRLIEAEKARAEKPERARPPRPPGKPAEPNSPRRIKEPAVRGKPGRR
ncbi:MAG TPA: peptidyl-prolyl cis-trans isomerase [Sedimentisphaerales bacterium]|nr:peptidyl-prolyl cis-trans isomerase [Sedimentisphaerales bacterium]